MDDKLMMPRRAVLRAAALLAASPAGAATPAPKDAYLYLISPVDGQRVRSPILCRFGLRNMGIAPAGVVVPNAGHHHLLIDVTDALTPDEPIPADRMHQHFGAGQTETRLDLPKGKHTLQLVMGDANHVPFDPVIASRRITITVI